MMFSRATASSLRQHSRRLAQQHQSAALRCVASVSSSSSLGTFNTNPHHASELFVDNNTIVDQWSRTMSFAAAESDFTSSDRFGPVNDGNTAKDANTAIWSQALSFASPEADFVGEMARDESQHVAQGAEWSSNLSFASPEADFVGEIARDENRGTHASEWSNELSFASPESDFIGQAARDENHASRASEWSNDLSFASAESDFVSSQARDITEDEAAWFERLLMSSSSSISQASNAATAYSNHHWRNTDMQDGEAILASPESALGHHSLAEMLSPDMVQAYMKYQRDSKALVDQNLVHVQVGQEHMPRTISEALEDPRPIVITSMSAPFVVFDVNDAWTGLCGYSREEALDRSLGELLQGPETDSEVARSMVGQLNDTNYSEAILTNYTKAGRPFKNHIQVGKLSTSDGSSDFFVGVLSDVGMTNAQNQNGNAHQYA